MLSAKIIKANYRGRFLARDAKDCETEMLIQEYHELFNMYYVDGFGDEEAVFSRLRRIERELRNRGITV